MEYQGFAFDIESDGFLFESEQVWDVHLKDLHDPSKYLHLHPYKDKDAGKKFVEFVKSYPERPLVVGHAILNFDMFVMKCLVDVDFQVGKKSGDTIGGVPVQFVDTWYWSMYLNPDRPGHSIEYFGEILGLEKLDFRGESVKQGLIKEGAPNGAEFKKPSGLMTEYNVRDVDVNIRVFNHLYEEHKNLYKGLEFPPSHFKAGQKSFFLMSCQEYSGFKFDVEWAKELQVKIAKDMEEIRARVEPQLPKRSLKKGEQKDFTMPAKPFKKDGTLSAVMEKWIVKHGATLLEGNNILVYGKEYPIEGGLVLDIDLPMKIADQNQLKEWLLESGWKPTLWNYKRGPDGKPMRDPNTRQLIPTSPKMQEQGKLCPNLEEMEGELVKDIVKWLSYRNRQSVLQGWMDDPRLQYDGRISARRSGIASTHRQRHAGVVNVPKADPKVLLGNEFRRLWICEEGNKIAAGDAAALEGRVQGHYCYRYDNGETAKVLLEGDIHSQNVKAFYSHIEEVYNTNLGSEDFDKEAEYWKPYRNRSKNGYYALMYGCAVAKLISTLGIPPEYGQAAMDGFWEANPGTKKLKDALERYWENTGKKKYLPAIDGRILNTRKKSALLNTIFQSCGGIVMDYACCFLDAWLGEIYWDEKRRPYYIYKGYVVRRIAYMHDEVEFECEEPVAQEVANMIELAIKKAGEFLKIKVPLAGEGKVGDNWEEVH